MMVAIDTRHKGQFTRVRVGSAWQAAARCCYTTGMARRDEITAAVKKLAMEAGFARVGIASVDADLHAEQFRKWLARGYHADMAYMKRNVANRLAPALLVDGARSVICLAVACGGGDARAGDAFVARYARGRNYHKVLKKRCRHLMDQIRGIAPEFAGRAFVDSGPVAERALAAAAGLGWIGRNGCLVAPGLGSYILLCEIICNLALAPDGPIASQCTDCNACVSACPTGAIVEDGLVDSRRCISYLTIENRGEIAPDLRPLMGTRVFGCDTCQEVCPHNRDLPAGDSELAAAGPPLGGAGIADILTWRAEDWDRATRGSAARRATYEMLLRNARIAAANLGD